MEQFNRQSLSAASKLSDQQQDAFAAVLNEQEPSQRSIMGLQMEVLPTLMLRMSANGIFAQNSLRRSQALAIVVQEQVVKGLETANRALMERLAQVLTPEQIRTYAQLQTQMLDAQLDWYVTATYL